MVIQWSEEDKCFIVTLPEFEGAKTHGETYAQAARMGRDLIESFFMWYKQDGKPLPRPNVWMDDLQNKEGRSTAPSRRRRIDRVLTESQ
jgi:predicted RNase H-like HicB family nuclease